MSGPYPHAMMPQTQHDERARIDFVEEFKKHLALEIMPGNRTVYERTVVPSATSTLGRPLKSRHEVREHMNHNPYFRMFGSLQRTSQEMLWDGVAESVVRQSGKLDAVANRAAQVQKSGSLKLDPKLKPPAYVTAVDIHCMPGGYAGEAMGQTAAGAIYDLGVYHYAMSSLGPRNSGMGERMIGTLKEKFSGLNPRRILDLGCTVGNATLPYVEAFPDAEIHAVDVSAPVLRYANARAQSFGAPIHFSQQNAEQTNFPDGHFDLVLSHILLHETSSSAIGRILRECHRLLAPGGVTAHAELGFFEGLNPYDAFILDYDTYNNNEPFWTTMREMNPVDLMRDAGFDKNEIFLATVPRDPGGKTVYSDNVADANGRGTWLVIGAQK